MFFFFRFVFLVSFMFCPCSLLFAAFCSWNELEAAISTAFATLYEPLIFYGIATVWCYLQHFGAGSCHLSTIFAAFLSSNFLFSMVFATCWCSNCSCNMVVATRVDYVDYLELVLVLVQGFSWVVRTFFYVCCCRLGIYLEFVLGFI